MLRHCMFLFWALLNPAFGLAPLARPSPVLQMELLVRSSMGHKKNHTRTAQKQVPQAATTSWRKASSQVTLQFRAQETINL